MIDPYRERFMQQVREFYPEWFTYNLTDDEIYTAVRKTLWGERVILRLKLQDLGQVIERDWFMGRYIRLVRWIGRLGR